jgi:DNA-binding response OmpR family regulator
MMAHFSCIDAICSGAGAAWRSPGKSWCIEDDRETADLIVEGLRDRRFEVSVAYRGPDGLMSIMRATPDPVLCDVGIPNMTGLEVLQRSTRSRRSWDAYRSSF